MIQVLFICVHNASRSQIAEAIFNRLAPPGMRAVSAGTEPAEAVNPVVVKVMAEAGIDLNGHRPKPVTVEMTESSTRVITMGCGVDQSCPLFLGVRIDEDWDLPDPFGKDAAFVRAVRDTIREKVMALIAELKERSHGEVS